ncbi:MAG: hypothetical protein AB7I50_01175 [Vicinamibacterales bacterium]
MKNSLYLAGFALALSATAFAAPNVANTTQKGSLLIFPDIRVDGDWNTLIRIANDANSDVSVKCYWMDGNKNRVDFQFPLTANQPFWFEARTGAGTLQVNRFPTGFANGFDNPFLVGPGVLGVTEDTDNNGAYQRGTLACWVVRYVAADVNGGGNDVDPCGCNPPPDPNQNDIGETQVKYNHLSGTATVFSPTFGSYEYNAYAFFVPSGADLDPIANSTPGVLRLNGLQYDQCPEYLIGQFTPNGAPGAAGPIRVQAQRLAVTACQLDLRQDWVLRLTKLKFDVWNEDEVRFTGAYDCADSWHETEFTDGLSVAPNTTTLTGIAGIDAAAQNFQFSTLQTFSARYRVRGIASDRCADPDTRIIPVGLLGVHSARLVGGLGDMIGTTLAGAGKTSDIIRWDPDLNGGLVPEGAIR